jgi:hypothetical protein
VQKKQHHQTDNNRPSELQSEEDVGPEDDKLACFPSHGVQVEWRYELEGKLTNQKPTYTQLTWAWALKQAPQPSVSQLIETLNTHRVNTLTELCRIERIAADCSDPNDAKAFQKPMTSAWIYYVTSHQLVTELRGLTPRYPMTGEVVRDAYSRVREDPSSNRSWNLAWLCLVKMKEAGLVAAYAAMEAMKPDMWGNKSPSAQDVAQLATCFETEWMNAVDRMLRHWTREPTWY